MSVHNAILIEAQDSKLTVLLIVAKYDQNTRVCRIKIVSDDLYQRLNQLCTQPVLWSGINGLIL